MHISVHNVNTLQGFEMQISTNPPLIFVNCAQLFFSIIYSPIFFVCVFFVQTTFSLKIGESFGIVNTQY